MRVCPQCGENYSGAEMFCPKDGARIIDPNTTEEIVHRRSVPPTADGSDSLVGSMVENRYRIIRRIGEGGMGVVYEAEHVEIEKKMALKVLRDDFSSKPDVVERFRQEARSASKIGNPHIVDVTDFGQLKDGGVFFVMEMLEGEALDELCTGTSVPLQKAAPIIDQIALALQAAHDKGIVHRDLKPENIFIVQRQEQGDFVKILDFGIAKISDRDSEGKRLTQTGMIFGTPEYMSPEQAAGKPLDHRVDVYALGCIMFELFTGRVPYTGDSFMAILTQHMFEPIPDIRELAPDSDVPDSVLSVVYKAMSKETATRYEDMDALREDLGLALSDANFIVDYPGREHSSSFVLNQLTRGSSGHSASRTTIDIKRSKKPLLIVGLSVAILLIGLVAILVASGMFSSQEPKDTSRIQTPKVEPLPIIEDEPVIVPENGDVPEAKKIRVKLDSIPSGAVMLIEGMGQVCSSAPCEVAVELGSPVEITAVVGEYKKTAVFTPSVQNTELSIEVDIPQEGSEGQSKKGTKKRVIKKKPGKFSEKKKRPSGTGSTGGLKIPDVFKNN